MGVQAYEPSPLDIDEAVEHQIAVAPRLSTMGAFLDPLVHCGPPHFWRAEIEIRRSECVGASEHRVLAALPAKSTCSHFVEIGRQLQFSLDRSSSGWINNLAAAAVIQTRILPSHSQKVGYAEVSPQVCDTSKNVTGLSRIGFQARPRSVGQLGESIKKLDACIHATYR